MRTCVCVCVNVHVYGTANWSYGSFVLKPIGPMAYLSCYSDICVCVCVCD